MAYPQTGILALGTPSHAYREFDPRGTASTRPNWSPPRPGSRPQPTTVTGVNLVVGFRPGAVGRAVAPSAAPAGVTGFAEPVVGPDGFTMPATQHDARAVVSGGAARRRLRRGRRRRSPGWRGVADVATEATGWLYQHRDRDLTGFIDGTENPSMIEAPDVAVVPDGPGAGASVPASSSAVAPASAQLRSP